MADQVRAGNDSAADAGDHGWRPSRSPIHRDVHASEGRIVEVQEGGGLIAAIGRFIKRPFVRLVLGLGIFILAAIVYDATVNFGEWTEKQQRPKATKHRGLAPVQETPDG